MFRLLDAPHELDENEAIVALVIATRVLEAAVTLLAPPLHSCGSPDTPIASGSSQAPKQHRQKLLFRLIRYRCDYFVCVSLWWWRVEP